MIGESLMKITESNKQRYIKKVLKMVLKKHCYSWLGEEPMYSSFDLKNAVNQNQEIKMDQIKTYIRGNCCIHENLWHVYEEIKNFKKFKDLLYYLAPRDYYNSRATLLLILRDSHKVKVVNKIEENRYYFTEVVDNIPESKEELLRDLKIYIRSHIQILLDIKKEPLNLDKLYDLFVKEEEEYDSGKKSQVFMLLYENKGKSVNEILLLINENNLKTPKVIFKHLIKADHNRFSRIIDEYYASENWNKNVHFKANLKLYDKYYHEKKYNKADELRRKVLQHLEETNLDKHQKKRIKRLITGHKKGGN